MPRVPWAAHPSLHTPKVTLQHICSKSICLKRLLRGIVPKGSAQRQRTLCYVQGLRVWLLEQDHRPVGTGAGAVMP